MLRPVTALSLSTSTPNRQPQNCQQAIGGKNLDLRMSRRLKRWTGESTWTEEETCCCSCSALLLFFLLVRRLCVFIGNAGPFIFVCTSSKRCARVKVRHRWDLTKCWALLNCSCVMGLLWWGQSASCERSSPPQTLIQLFVQIFD